MKIETGYVSGVNGNLINVDFDGSVRKNEVGYILVGDKRLKGEVIRIRNGVISMQIYEMTEGIQVGDKVEFTGELMSVDLGPGLLSQVFDGLQNPLPALAEQCGFFLERGVYLDAIPDRDWEFTPTVNAGDPVRAGSTVGTVPEGLFTNHIMVPFTLKGDDWKVKSVKEAGTYNVHANICTIENSKGETRDLTMVFTQPVKQAVTCYEEKIRPDEPLVTKLRCIDGFLPVAKGGTFCTPGPFGAGKTVLQHMQAKNSDVDVVIVAACGERAGEVVEVLTEFPELEDPKTGRSLMERTIIICNTSSMPVAAREASVYTAVTLAEYYRQMGLDVLLLADSTSRWAQALREMSNRMEELPGADAFPVDLSSIISNFYSRAGIVKLNNGETGSVTFIGTVSPAGGNLKEPVTESTKKAARCFYALEQARADSKRYPAVNPLDSYSKYLEYPEIIEYLDKKVRPGWVADVMRAKVIVRRGKEMAEQINILGDDGVPLSYHETFWKSELIDFVILQQDAFDPIDSQCLMERQDYILTEVLKVCDRKFDFETFEEYGKFFKELINVFRQMNFTPWKSEQFYEYQEKLNNILSNGNN